MWTLIICFFGLVLGYFLADQIGDDRKGNITKVILIIALIVFAMWNEGVI